MTDPTPSRRTEAPATPEGAETEVSAVAPERPVDETIETVIKQRLSDALGGWYGSLETALPTVAFVLGWTITSDLPTALIASGVTAGVMLVIRFFIKGSFRFVATSLFAVALAAFFALRSGDAQDAFLPGILFSAGYGLACLLSILARWPAIGFLVAVTDPEFNENPTRWRKDRAMVRVCSRLTWVLVGLFVLRVGVMLPLYLAGNVPALGTAKIVLGWPAYLLAVVVMGWLLVRGRTAQEPVSSASRSR